MHANAVAPEIGSRRWISALEARVDGRVVDVTATSSGRIAQIFVAEGELVGKDDTLVELGDIVSASAPVRVAVRASTNGRVLTRHLVAGDRASFGQTLLTVVEDDDVWVLARFDAADFERLCIGQSALVRSGGRLLAAKVCALGSDDLNAVLDFVLRPATLRPGMIASAVVFTDRHGT